ncbi:MAG: hypothetical protein EBV95_04250 [Actinobacteria bacterium]|nr:hypothetical protein [Actinomycetota bacterium]
MIPIFDVGAPFPLSTEFGTLWLVLPAAIAAVDVDAVKRAIARNRLIESLERMTPLLEGLVPLE